MSTVVVLEWSFTPPNYFEEPIEISRHDYTMTISDGSVQAKIDSAINDANTFMRQELHDSLNDRFLGVQLLTHRAYELSKSTMTRVYPDGRKDLFIEVGECLAVADCMATDILTTDKDGNVIYDSKRDRTEKMKNLMDLIHRHRPADNLLASLLRSYDTAVRDPANELVHLYEIRDALSSRFGGESAARGAFGISSSQWSRMAHLCNNESLRQGRHRGKTRGALRDASEGELKECRDIARTMIEGYLETL